MSNENKIPVDIVIWSGGLDSTLVLEKLCSAGTPVWAFSIVWKEIIEPLKTKQEQKIRKEYLEYAKNKGYNIEYRI